MNRPPFPFPMPFGWFSVGRVDELPDAPSAVSAFGTELVVWSSSAGAFDVAEAWCPHLGAHLGVGSRVDDGCLVCPFHEWTFDGEGRNVSIPYADRPNGKARLRTFPTVVVNGAVLCWYHPGDAGPLWDVPQVLDPSFTECGRYDVTVHTVWQEIAENSVDMAHFCSVHGLSQMGEVGEVDLDGPFRHVRSSQLFNTARGEFSGAIESHSFGPGMGVTHFDLMGRVTLISTTTPLDGEAVRVRFTAYHSGEGAAPKIGPAFAAEVQRQFEQDIVIWEAKRYQPSPALAPSEKPITEFRRWASQFYAATSA